MTAAHATAPPPDDDPPAAEAWPVLEYGRASEATAQRWLRGLATLLLICGGVGFVAEMVQAGIGAYTLATENYVPVRGFYIAITVTSLVGAFVAACYFVGGIGCLRGRTWAARVIAAGAWVSLATIALSPFVRTVALHGGTGAAAFSMQTLLPAAFQTLQSFTSALLPLTLLWLFRWRLIRDAIGVK